MLFLLSSICYLVIRYILNLFSIFDNSSDNKLAKEVKLRSKFINDRLFNALQLENSLNLITKGKDLAEHAISIINKDIKTISIKSLYDPIKPKVKNFIKLTFFITIIIIFTFSESLLNSYNRLFQPNKNFPIPKPFILNSLSGNIKILGGDTAKVSVAGYGDLPDSILIFWQQQENINKISIAQKDEVYEHTFLNITKNIYYWGEFKSQNFFSPWNVIATKKDTIFVKDRPVIKDLYFTILPPNYTNLVKYQHPGNITDISVPLGSRLEINVISSKNLIEAWTINNIKHNLNVNMNKFQGGLYIG